MQLLSNNKSLNRIHKHEYSEIEAWNNEIMQCKAYNRIYLDVHVIHVCHDIHICSFFLHIQWFVSIDNISCKHTNNVINLEGQTNIHLFRYQWNVGDDFFSFLVKCIVAIHIVNLFCITNQEKWAIHNETWYHSIICHFEELIISFFVEKLSLLFMYSI